MEACEKLYTSTLEKCSVPLDPGTLPTPMPRELDLLEARHKERLLLLADVLRPSPVFQRDFIELRSRFLLGTIRRLPAAVRRSVSAKKTETPLLPRAPEAAGASGAASSTLSSSLTAVAQLSGERGVQGGGGAAAAAEGEEDESKLFGEFTLVFLRMAEHERRLALEIFEDGPVFANCFSAVLEGLALFTFRFVFSLLFLLFRIVGFVCAAGGSRDQDAAAKRARGGAPLLLARHVRRAERPTEGTESSDANRGGIQLEHACARDCW